MTADWNPPEACSPAELALLKLCKKQPIWSFLRRYRHRILDAEMREFLAGMYASGSRRGGSPVAPERLALAMLLQVLFGTPDHEVPTLTVADRRWQMVLDCDGATRPAMSQATVFAFRERARANGLADKLLEKTVELARETKGFSDRRLRALIDSSPLWGAGRVEDTFNLLGRAIGQLVEVAAREAGVEPSTVAAELDLSVVGASSVKAALDVDWRRGEAREAALSALLGQVDRVRAWLGRQFSESELEQPPIGVALALVDEIVAQDTEPHPDGPEGASARRIRQGGEDRRISVSDPDMRHGRKSKTKLFHGYKRHVVVDADIPGLIHAVEVVPANAREHEAVPVLVQRVEARGYDLAEAHVDRGYLAAEVLHDRRASGLVLLTKPPTLPRTGRYTKYDFDIDYEAKALSCPGGQTIPYRGDGKSHRFKASICAACTRRSQCTNASPTHGRNLTTHKHERFFRDMTVELGTPKGRALRRQRVPVEHALGRLGQVQGTRARFRGLDKNAFDTTRSAAAANLYVLDRLWRKAA